MNTNASSPDKADHGVLRFITAGSVDDGKSTRIGRVSLTTREL
jgi:sulfate adenylyltransferase subunit 1 (EFTu-like GTPase family)